MRQRFTGCGTALVTPFTRDLAVDEAAVSRLARRQIEAGIHFLVPCGTTGESPTLSDDERARVVELVAAEARGKVPVLAGAGGYDTKEVIHAGRRMQQAGADGLLSVTPYYNKPTPEGLYQHYRAIADAVPLPIIVYNVPGRTGCNVDPATLARLATIPNVVGVKEASGNMTQMCEVCRAVPEDFIVLSGDDVLTLPLMAVGGRGIISVASNEVPAQMSRMVEAAERGDFSAARRIHHDLQPLMMINFIESNPIPVKTAMATMGLLEEIYRLPMVPARQDSRAKIQAVLQSLKLVEPAPARS
jgi:4-hydroxy-tetrahydrodipicolinate synthase